MSVSTTGVAITYNGDGSTSMFTYPNYLFEPGDLVVQVTVSGTTTTYVLNAQPGFTFAGAADTYGAFPSGGNVELVDGSGNPNPPPGGSSIFITRQTPKNQQISFLDNDPFPASTLEHGLDKACLWAQEQTLFAGFSNGAPASPGTVIGSWYQQIPAVPGGNFGWVWTGSVWSPFGLISL